MAFLALAMKRLFSPIFIPRFFSSSSTQNPDPKSSPAFVLVDYLVSTRIAHLKSPQNPDAVRSFLQHQGFDEAGIKSIITGCPGILCSSLQDTIAPNLLALRDIGLSASALTQIILSSPQALRLSSAVPRINFWRDFVGGEDATLVKLCKRNRGLLNHDINKGIATKMFLLQSKGMSKRDIQWLFYMAPQFITKSVSSMEDSLNRVRELGFQSESKMFAIGLLAMGSATREVLQKKKELFKSLGWSEDEFLTAVRKSPTILCLSEKNLRAKMDFLLGQTKSGLSYIAFHPVLLTLSLEKRLRPCLHVLGLLESKDIFVRKKNLCAVMQATNSMFVTNYILPHIEGIPRLHEVYLAACASTSA